MFRSTHFAVVVIGGILLCLLGPAALLAAGGDPASLDWGSTVPTGGISDSDGATGLQNGDLVELIWAGPDGEIDPPQCDGSPGDDDQLLAQRALDDTSLPGPLQGNGYLVAETYNYTTGNPENGGIIYIRAWNDTSPATAAAYGDSGTETLNGSNGQSWNANSWHTNTSWSLATWNGAADADWNTGSNWSTGTVPDNTTNVTIANNSSIQLSANAAVKCLDIGENATLDLNTFDLTVEEVLNNNGAIEQTKDVPNGSTTSILQIQNQAGTETAYYGVDITPDGGAALGSTFVRILGNQDCTTPAEAMVQRCFNIEPTTSNSATIRYWLLPSELNSESLTSLQLWDWQGMTWAAVGDTATYGSDDTCSTGEANCWYQYSNIDSFSPHVANDSQPSNPPTAPLAVSLATFEATAMNGHVLITWQTVSELNNLGFNVWRGTSPDAPDTQVNQNLIPSEVPGSGQGAYYQQEDTDVEEAVTYYYWLEDMDTSGTLTRHGPVSATVDDEDNDTTSITISAPPKVKPSSETFAALASLGLIMLAGTLIGLRRRLA